MLRVALENRAQKDKFGPGKHGYQGGNPITGVLATIPGAEVFDAFQEEIANVIENAGMTLQGKDYNQLYQAILHLISHGCGLPVSGAYDAQKKYSSGTLIFVDGEWYECYHPEGCKGKDPRDPLNRPVGWQNTDPSQPYYWLKIGKWLSFPEVGSPIYLPTTKIREGLIKYRNDGHLHKNKFWRIAELYPDLIKNDLINIADLRAEFIRGLDDGRGIDAGRQIGSWQIGTPISHDDPVSAEVFDVVSMDCSARKFGDKWTGELPTAFYSAPYGHQSPAYSNTFFTMTRPRNVAMLIATRI